MHSTFWLLFSVGLTVLHVANAGPVPGTDRIGASGGSLTAGNIPSPVPPITVPGEQPKVDVATLNKETHLPHRLVRRSSPNDRGSRRPPQHTRNPSDSWLSDSSSVPSHSRNPSVTTSTAGGHSRHSSSSGNPPPGQDPQTSWYDPRSSVSSRSGRQSTAGSPPRPPSSSNSKWDPYSEERERRARMPPQQQLWMEQHGTDTGERMETWQEYEARFGAYQETHDPEGGDPSLPPYASRAPSYHSRAPSDPDSIGGREMSFTSRRSDASRYAPGPSGGHARQPSDESGVLGRRPTSSRSSGRASSDANIMGDMSLYTPGASRHVRQPSDESGVLGQIPDARGSRSSSSSRRDRSPNSGSSRSQYGQY
ncbi:hypothetical protein EX30DRAFT_352342 [Ascodesmis nigricans]|uniref:Uncharacterized protein n=1 Tax=Ascodesmis nigricans TaxID=341454 RepID=A0A4S2MQH5_9PEZI|nr:hypothetical protein EX30DRAFT_352342 [Ascodesmis nigricans]